ncbi:MAG: VOC family protein [Verrucomicrobia bacterium]|nr:VOC family protein [Verrucomicrobiota bacterium]
MKFSPEHFGLAAADPVGLKNWYVRALGAEVVCELDKTPPAFMLALAGGFLIEIYQANLDRTKIPDNKSQGWRHLALRVDSLESTRAELAQRGIKFTEPIKPAGGGGRVLFFRDAEGNLLHLVEREAASAWLSKKQY